MNAVYKSLKQVNELNPDQWTGFKAMYSASPEARSSDALLKKLQGLISSSQLQSGQKTIDQITKQLQSLSAKINPDNKAVSADQLAKKLRDTLKKITERQLGTIEDSVISTVDSQVFQTIGKQNNIPSSTIEISQKANIIQNNGVRITQSAEKNSKDNYTVKGELVSQMKWFDEIVAGKQDASGQLSGPIQIAQSSSYVDWIKRVFGSSVSSMYGVYNTLAFKNAGEAYSNSMIIKSQVIQNSLDLFLTGRTSVGEGLDLKALMFVNGKIYPIAAILVAAIKQLETRPNIYGSSASDIVYMTTYGDSNLDNQWVGNPGIPNLGWAFARSQRIKSQINKIGMRVTLNPGELQISLNKMNVQPL